MNQRLISAFIDALGVTAVYVAVAPERVKIGCAKDPAVAIGRADAARIHLLAWCQRVDHAKMLVDACHDALRDRCIKLSRGWFTMPADEAAQLLLGMAEELGVTLQSDDELRGQAAAAVEKIIADFERMRRAGELRDLNRRYRSYRLAKTAEGAKAQSYGAWIAAYKIGLVRQAATIAAGSHHLSQRLAKQYA